MSLHELESEKELTRYLLIATGLHIVVVIILFLIQLIGGFSFFVSKDKKQLKVIESAVRVDIVGMPKYTVQELKKMKVTPVTNSSEKNDVQSDVLSDVKNDQTKVDLNKLLKKISNKKVKVAKTKAMKKSKTKKRLDRKALRSLVLEGNKVSKGSALVGDSLASEQTVFNEYIAGLPNFVRPNWKLPSYLMGKELKCRVRIFIAANGKIVKAQIFESSGVAEFDNKALRAVNMSNPLPAPVSEILGRVSAGEVVLGFPL